MMEARSKIIALPKSVLRSLIVSFLVFFIPFLFSQQQLPTGIFVNAALFLSVFFLPASERLPIIILPSLAALMRGIVFGVYTPVLLYLLPVIWVGNYLLTVTFEAMMARISIGYAGVIGSLAKCAVLYGCAFILYRMHIAPVLFLTAMGIMQLMTALGGFVVAYGIYTFISKEK